MRCITLGSEGERLREARKGRYTQQELANVSGIPREKIARIETGTRRMSATDAAYLARALDLSADDLVGRPEPRIRLRLTDEAIQGEVASAAEWFEDFIKDVFYLERSVRRYGLD